MFFSISKVNFTFAIVNKSCAKHPQICAKFTKMLCQFYKSSQFLILKSIFIIIFAAD